MAAPAGSMEAGVRPAIDPRVGTEVISGFSWIVGVAAIVWGSAYLVLGLPSAAFYPFLFAAISIVNWLAYIRHGRPGPFAWVVVVIVLVVPAMLTIHLGGLVASGLVGLWSMLAPIGALLVLGPRAATWVFGGFVLLVAAMVLVPGTGIETVSLPAAAIDVFTVFDMFGVAIVMFLAARTFVRVSAEIDLEQQRLRGVERAYVQQEAMLRQQERLATLGRLSAGVAHELNNPAAAAGRATGHLGEVVDRLIDDAVELLGFGLSADGLAWVRSTATAPVGEDALDRSDREGRIARWLESGAVEDAWDLAPDLAALGFDTATLDEAAERYRRRQVVAALRWIADVARAQALVREVRSSTQRISAIVGSLKGYSHMDGAERTVVDVVNGIEDTLTILRSKLTNIVVEMDVSDAVPAVMGNPGELNQVWTNLIANAAEAIADRSDAGLITIRVVAAESSVRVHVIDDGPGIPSSLIDRIFDPFVTTKPPGEGTGLGLNISHQIIVDRHGGSIDVDASPGRTEFTVTLPSIHQEYRDE